MDSPEPAEYDGPVFLPREFLIRSKIGIYIATWDLQSGCNDSTRSHVPLNFRRITLERSCQRTDLDHIHSARAIGSHRGRYDPRPQALVLTQFAHSATLALALLPVYGSQLRGPI